jgi:hypothetical protein
MHNALKMWIGSQLLVVRARLCLQTAIKCALPLSAETGILPQMGIDGVAGDIRGIARENHLRIPAESREKRFPPRKCPLQ